MYYELVDLYYELVDSVQTKHLTNWIENKGIPFLFSSFFNLLL